MSAITVVDHPRRATALIATAELHYLRALRQRGLIHRLRNTAVVGKYRAVHPAAMTIRETDREGVTPYLRFPREHHVRSRRSHFIERAGLLQR